MDQNILQKKLLLRNPVYILDEFEEASLRLVYDGVSTKAFLKHKGMDEISISQSNETVCEIILSGKEITKSEYDEY